MAQAEELDLGQGAGGGRTGAGVEERQLTDQLAGAEHGQHVLPAVGGSAVELHLALGDHVQAVAGVAFVEQRVATGEGRLAHGGAELRGLLVVERREERRAPQNIVHEFSPMSTCSGNRGPHFAGRVKQCDQSQGCRTGVPFRAAGGRSEGPRAQVRPSG